MLSINVYLKGDSDEIYDEYDEINPFHLPPPLVPDNCAKVLPIKTLLSPHRCTHNNDYYSHQKGTISCHQESFLAIV